MRIARIGALIALTLALPAAADEFPARQITLIAPWPPGGAIDALCRALAPGLGDGLGKPKTPFDLGLEAALSHLDGAVEPQEVGRGEQVDVEHVALDPFGAVQEAAQLVRALRDLDLEQPLQAVNRAHLIGDRADAADSGHDVGYLREVAARQERFEEPGGS